MNIFAKIVANQSECHLNKILMFFFQWNKLRNDFVKNLSEMYFSILNRFENTHAEIGEIEPYYTKIINSLTN